MEAELGMSWIVLIQPSFDLFLLGSSYNALPFHHTRAFAVFSHNVGPFIQYLDEAVGLCPFESEGRECRMVFVHAFTRIADVPNCCRKSMGCAVF